MIERADHWTRVYATKRPDEVSWFQPQAATSLGLIAETGAPPAARLVDVGGGASPLVRDLLARGWTALSVLDIAETGLEASRGALGTDAGKVEWIAADVTGWRPAAPFDVWHDRAVFHFLTEPEQRAQYRRALAEGLSVGGWLILAAFAPDGPERCSGLPVQRWSPEGLADELGPGFALVRGFQETHTTPWGATQLFTWTLFRRRA